MQAMKLFHKIFKEKLPFVNKTRIRNVVLAAEALINSSKLSLTALGRNISGNCTVRSNIKKIDRLIGNHHLHKESIVFYKEIASMIIVTSSSPWIQVDWTCKCSITNLYILRASLAAKGRSIVLYEEVHPKEYENNNEVHKKFLESLKSILPQNVKPVIITDAGFRTPWFKAIFDLGWDFVGRLRNKNLVRLTTSSDWQLSSSLYEKATTKPTYLGQGIITEKNKFLCSFVLYKEKYKSRQKLNKDKSKCKTSKSKKYAKAQREPWLLVSSIKPCFGIAKKVVNRYKTRMQIEENIRDTKSIRYGFALKDCRSKSPARVNILLLIAAIATFVCWLAGLQCKQSGCARNFQTQSSKFTCMLSLVTLGREALKKGLKMTRGEFILALEFFLSTTVWQSAEDS
jgi:hypothetical protein